MATPIHGDLNIYGVVTVGSRTENISSGEAYTLPYNKGANLSVLAITQAPTSTGLTGTMVQWVDPTASPLNLVTSFTLSAAINAIPPVGITGQSGITVIQVSANQFIISLYVPLTASLSSIPSSLEVGQSITAATLNWSYNKPAVVSQSIDNGIGSLAIGLRTYNYTTSTPITSNKTFTLTGNDGVQNANSSATITFSKKRYWGTSPSISAGLPGNAQILAGNQELSSTRVKTITFDCSTPSGGNFFWYTYPTAFGLANVTINNLTFASWFDPATSGSPSVSPATISVTNPYGHVENYYMYRVFNVQNGSNIPVSFQ